MVAPMNMSVPSSTNGRNVSCCALLKRCTSSRNSMVGCRQCARASFACSTAARMSFTPAITADSARNCASRAPREHARQRGLAGAGRAPQDHGMQLAGLDARGAAACPARAGAAGRRTRRACAAACGPPAGASCRESRPCAVRCWRSGARPTPSSFRAGVMRQHRPMPTPKALAIRSRQSASRPNPIRPCRSLDGDRRART